MAQFDESKVINALHPEKAEVGKKYWRSDNLLELKRLVEENSKDYIGELDRIRYTDHCPFEIKNGNRWQFIYPYEEPQNQRMTNRQLAEWLAKGNGEWKFKDCYTVSSGISYDDHAGNEKVGKDKVIRPWDSYEWIEPTLEVYLKYCKGDKK